MNAPRRIPAASLGLLIGFACLIAAHLGITSLPLLEAGQLSQAAPGHHARLDDDLNADSPMHDGEDHTGLDSKPERDAAPLMQRWHRRVARHVHALTAEWSALRVRFITPLPPPAPTQTPLPVHDPAGCSAVGQQVVVGRLAVLPPHTVACNQTQVTECWIRCNATHIVSPARAAALGLVLQRIGGLLEARFVTQSSLQSISFFGERCARFNISGFHVGNVFVLATMRPEGTTWMASAASYPCRVDDATQRPLLFHINVVPALLDNITAAQNVVLRVLLHGMGLSVPMMGHWLHPNAAATYFEHDPVAFPTGPIAGLNVTLVNNTIIRVLAPRPPGAHVQLRSPNALAAARAHFRCPTLEHVELEDAEFDNMFYLEKRLFRGELMTREEPLSEMPLRLSPITVGALLDTGWYARPPGSNNVGDAPPVAALAHLEQRLEWGRHLGCTFTSVRCSTGGWPPHYFCIDRGTEPRCGFDRTFTGRCNNRFLGFNVPEAYRIFQNSLADAGMDVFTDRCPYVEPHSPTAHGHGFCTFGSQPVDAALARPSGFRVGEDSRCFMTSVLNSSSQHFTSTEPRTTTSCHQVICVGTVLQPQRTLMTRIGDVFVPCLDGLNFTFVAPRAGIESTAPHIVENPSLSGVLHCGTHMQQLCGTTGIVNRSAWPAIAAVNPARGAKNGGFIVTITGTSLVSCTGVRFGGVLTRDVVYNFPSAALHVRTPFIPSDMGSSTNATTGTGMTDVELFCAIPTLCDEGCFAARLTKGFLLSEMEPCSETRDLVNCRATPVCEWNGTHCIDFIPTVAPTPPPVLTPAPESFVDPRCAITAPVFCEQTHRCAASLDLCLGCSAPLVQCWNSACRVRIDQCDCTPETPTRCAAPAGGHWCAPQGDTCTQPPWLQCNATHPHRCSDGGCVIVPEDCAACPREAPFRCNVTSSFCVARGHECELSAPQQCPLDRCFFRDPCVLPQRTCACPHAAPFRCWDDVCVRHAGECSCEPQRPHRCPSGTCAAAAIFCLQNATRLPCQLSETRCSDEVCRANALLCPCAERPIPGLQILATPQRVQFNTWSRIAVRVYFAPCGVDRRHEVHLRWSLEEVPLDRGEEPIAAPPPIRAALTEGTILHVPPFALSPNRLYRVRATAVHASHAVTVSETLLNAVARPPFVFIRGGNRDVSGARPLVLEAVVVDATFERDNIRWSCCVANAAGEACVDSQECPQLYRSVADVSSRIVVISSVDLLPPGSFFFRARYKATSSSVRVGVQPEHAPTCRLAIAPQHASLDHPFHAIYAHLPLMVLAEVDFEGQTTINWNVNVSALGGDSGYALSFAPNALPAGVQTLVSLTVTTASDQISRCEHLVHPVPPPSAGLCTVRNDSPDDLDFQTDLATAGRSLLRIHTVGWGAGGGSPIDPLGLREASEADAPLFFRFSYIDATGQNVLLSTEFVPTPEWVFTAPLMLRNPSLITTRFVVEVATIISVPWADEGEMSGSYSVPLMLRNTTCTADLKSAAERPVVALVEDLFAATIGSASAGLLDLFLQRASVLKTLLSDGDLATSRVANISRVILTELEALVSVGINGSESASALRPVSPTAGRMASDVVRELLPFLSAPVPSAPACGVAMRPAESAATPPCLDARDAAFVQSVLKAVLSLRDGDVLEERALTAITELLQWSFVAPTSTAVCVQLLRRMALTTPHGATRTAVLEPPPTSPPTPLGHPVVPHASRHHQRVRLSVLHLTRHLLRSAAAFSLSGPISGQARQTLHAGDVSPSPELLLPTSAILAADGATQSGFPHIFLQIIAFANAIPTAIDAGLTVALPSANASNASAAVVGAHDAPAAQLISDAVLIDVRHGRNSFAVHSLLHHLEHRDLPGPSTRTTTSGSEVTPQELLEAALNASHAALRMVVDITHARTRFETGQLAGPTERDLECFYFAPASNTWRSVGRPSFVALEAPTVVPANEGDARAVVLRAVVDCPVHRFGLYGVFDRSFFPPATPAPTPLVVDVDGQGVIAFARSLSGGIIAAIALGSLVFVAGVGLAAYLWRERVRSAAVDAENKQTSELLLVSDLLAVDDNLRHALEIARVRRLYGEQL